MGTSFDFGGQTGTKYDILSYIVATKKTRCENVTLSDRDTTNDHLGPLLHAKSSLRLMDCGVEAKTSSNHHSQINSKQTDSVTRFCCC